MRVLLKITSGPQDGTNTLLGANKLVRVGRSDWADITCANDEEMSKLHFQIETDHLAVYLKDLNSSNGTLLNNEPVGDVCVVRDRDRILAGQTEFEVHVDGDSPEEAERLRAESAAADRAADQGNQLEEGALLYGPTYSAEVCESGLTLFRGGDFGDDRQPSCPSLLAGVLSKQIPLTLVLHYGKIGVPPPPEAVPLFDWLPEPVAAENSPWIIKAELVSDVAELIDEAWDHDALLCLYSHEDAEDLVAHLRRAVRFNSQGLTSQGERQLLGYCWPSVLSQLLAFRSADFVGRLLATIDAVLMELPDLPGSWQILSTADFGATLEEAGLEELLPTVAEETGETSESDEL